MAWEKVGGSSYKYEVFREKEDKPPGVFVWIIVGIVLLFAAKGCNDSIVHAEPKAMEVMK